MRSLAFGLSAWLVLAVPASAAPDPQITAPIRQFIEAFNKGDGKTAAATHVQGDVAIVDEVAPHLWRGPGAFNAWSKDLGHEAETRGQTENFVALGEPTRQVLSGKSAYVVVPTVYTYKERGVAMREAAQMTFVLQEEAGAWKILSWTWTGPDPQPVSAK